MSVRPLAVVELVLAGSWMALVVVLSLSLLLPGSTSLGLWLMAVVPLLLTLPGLLRRHGRSLQWLCFLVLFHFVLGVLQAFSADPRLHWLGLGTTLLCVLLFTAAIVNLRHWRRHGDSGG